MVGDIPAPPVEVNSCPLHMEPVSYGTGGFLVTGVKSKFWMGYKWGRFEFERTVKTRHPRGEPPPPR